MGFTLQQLAELVQGRLCGDAELIITGISPLEDAQAGQITFVENARYAAKLPVSHASAAVVPEGLPANELPVIRVADALAAFVKIARHFQAAAPLGPPRIDRRADIDSTATIGPDARIDAFSVVGAHAVVGARCHLHTGSVVGPACRLGDDVTLHPHAVLYERTVLGHRVVVHAGAVLGADGFGYRTRDGRHLAVPQLGHVEVGDDVDIGAGTTIDRGTFEATTIGEGTKIDNQVQIAHNCHIGRHNLIVSQVGIAGSCRTGDHVVLAGQVGLADHVALGDGVAVGAKAGVVRDAAAGERLLGVPATSEYDHKRVIVLLDKLPELRRDVKRVKRHLGLEDDRAASA